MACDGGPCCVIAANLQGRGSLLRASKHEWMAASVVSAGGRTLAFVQRSFDNNDVWLLEPR